MTVIVQVLFAYAGYEYICQIVNEMYQMILIFDKKILVLYLITKWKKLNRSELAGTAIT